MPHATSADGTRVYYELEGAGPAVVLQHVPHLIEFFESVTIRAPA